MATQNLKSYSYSTESLKKIIFLATVCLITVVGLLYSFFLLGSLGDGKSPDTQDNKPYIQKEIAYAPIECFLDEWHYNVSCVDEYENSLEGE